MDQIVIALDYDGVLVDSYNGLERFYLEDLPAITGRDQSFGKYLLYMEYLTEGCGLLRIDWWPSVMNIQDDLLDHLLWKYWERRIENSAILPGVFTALDIFRKRNYRIIHIGFMDDIPGLKRWRLDADGLAPYFDEIIVVGEDTPSRHEALKYLEETYENSLIVYVDDKPVNLFKINAKLGNNPRILLVRKEFKKQWSFPWDDPAGSYPTIKNLLELERILRDHVIRLGRDGKDHVDPGLKRENTQEESGSSFNCSST